MVSLYHMNIRQEENCIMDKFRVLEIKESVFESNDREADKLREELKKEKTFLLNLMSSPGSGKTTTLMATIEALKDDLSIGVMEADIDSDVDAATISTSGAKVIQLHTGGMCHLDAGMTRQGLEGLGTDGVDLAILENIGNLVCPAEFDTGAVKNAMILSVPEGDDKPLKYPLMFSICDVLLVNKIDVAPYFNFSLDKCVERVKKLNPNIQVFPISALKKEGIEPWANWLREQVKSGRLTDQPERQTLYTGCSQVCAAPLLFQLESASRWSRKSSEMHQIAAMPTSV